ncbi:hypothetical protein HT102_09405 [Hoyosella sp. G463]|uniref:Ligand-binding SRPBCC domain-containing protein n=1 Tax=Lolliginicoccus lacisalsi TaxID=2742202 RepID=A0A927JDL4_9ACTN|nr:hypothetical protein [Lolliginicoccus lacisalsi]
MIVHHESIVDAPIEQVWARVVSPEGINDEMRPWLTMSLPLGTEHRTIDTVTVGAPLGKAWLRLFGVVPFDFDDLMIAELDPGRRFHEKSTMLSMRRWEHERVLAPAAGGRTLVRDRITLVPRVALRPATRLIGYVLNAFFAHRHRRLQQHFG